MRTHEAADDTLPEVREVDREEGMAILDAAARRELGMSGKEFLAAWDRGEFEGKPEHAGVIEVSMLIPFAR